MMGMIIWCFYQKPEFWQCQYVISIMLTVFPLRFLVCTFPSSVFDCFHFTATCGNPSFLGHSQPRGVLLEKTWVEIQLKTFTFPFDLINWETTSGGTDISSSTKRLNCKKLTQATVGHMLVVLLASLLSC